MRPLAIIGNVNVDLILGPAEPWPRPGTEIIVDYDELRVGGSAGNSALVWEAFGLDYQMAANIGDDHFGYWLRDSFSDKARNWPVEQESTTLTVGITHPDGERTFFTTRGHLPHLRLAQVQTMIDTHKLQGGIALLCGSFLTDGLVEEYDGLFSWAKQNRIALALDTGWPLDGWTEGNINATKTWISHCTILMMNEVEITSLSGVGDPVKAAQKIHKLMPQKAIVVVKCGAEGALAIGEDGKICRAPAPVVEVVDTIGAGDVFNAAFLAALAGGNNVQHCLEQGVLTASTAVSTTPRIYNTSLLTQED
ncbi:carbohydrate kinase family protein [Pseudochrobactrum sp. HB0163]|uniref:carbohydrate kinase family protein n=1 Tax=Pseudochrobactrum sp. HB0163 TaxID=3450708 RepID=UPI003F6E3481